MSSKEEEDRFIRLTAENEELKLKIADKERLIEEVKKKIEQMTIEQMEMKKVEDKGAQVKTTVKKAVRIQEPNCEEHKNNHHLSEIHSDIISDSGFASAKTLKPIEADISESYL